MTDMSCVIAAGPVIIENGSVLLVRHGDDAVWKFPGGKREEADADLESTAKREAREELGIEVELLSPLKPMVLQRPGGIAVLIHFLAKRLGEVRPGPDILEWRWFPLHELPPEAAPNIGPVLAELK